MVKLQNNGCPCSDEISRVVCLCFGLSIFFVMGMHETVLGPFLPTVFADYHIPELKTGIVVAAYEVGSLVSSLLFLTVTDVDHRRFSFCLFSIIAGLFIILFGIFIFIKSIDIFVVISIIIRSIVGLSVGVYYCSLSSLFFSMFPNDTGKISSLVSTSASSGFILGTPFGSFFFGLGGYFLPFLVLGVLQIVLSVVTFAVLSANSIEPVSEKIKFDNSLELKISEQTSRAKLLPKETKMNIGLSATEFLNNKDVIWLSLAVMSTTTSIGFVIVGYGPLLLTRFGIPEEQQGFYFLPFTIIRAVIAPVFGYFTDKGFAQATFTVFGCLFSSVSMMLLALPGYFEALDSLVYMEIMLILTGLSSTGVLVPFVALLRKRSQKSEENYPEVLNSYFSAMFSVCYSIGVSIGEIFYGGILLQELGFHKTCFVQFVVGAFVFCFDILRQIKK